MRRFMNILMKRLKKLKQNFLFAADVLVQALLEAIEQKDRIESLEKKARDKERSASEDLNKVLAGKKTMKTLLSKKSKEEEVAEFEKIIANVIYQFPIFYQF